MLLFLLACAPPPAPTRPPPDACAVMATPAPGPLDTERAQSPDDPLALARLRIREARLTGDPGFYTLADTAVECALLRAPTDLDAQRLRAHLLIQFHQFAEAESVARAMLSGPVAQPHWLDHALLGDALMEQGKLDAAGEAYQAAVNLRPGLEMYDRIGWLRWLWGDVEGALEMQRLAVGAGSSLDPEPFAWVLTRLGWLNALSGRPAPELDAALTLVPDYPPARFARGRARLASGDKAGAIEDLTAAGPTVEAIWALSEAGVTPARTVTAVRAQDPRGYAIWLTNQPGGAAEAVALLEAELKIRQDPVTRMALAYARFQADPGVRDALRPEAESILGIGLAEPRVLFQAGLLLSDPALLARALAAGPGLLPSERDLATFTPEDR